MLKTDNEAFNQEFDEIKEQFYKVMQKISVREIQQNI